MSQEKVRVERSSVGGEAVSAGPLQVHTGSRVHLASLTRLEEEELGFTSQRWTLVSGEELPDLVRGVGVIVTIEDSLITMSQNNNFKLIYKNYGKMKYFIISPESMSLSTWSSRETFSSML